MSFEVLVGICFILWMLKDAPFFSIPVKNALFVLMLVFIVVFLMLGAFHGPLFAARS